MIEEKYRPFPGLIGEEIAKNVSKEQWEEWLEVKMKIINEERLDLSESSSQARLFDAMVSFLHLEEVIEK